MKTGTRILFIDDEIYGPSARPTGNYMLYYLRALERAGVDLTAVDGTDKALDELFNAKHTQRAFAVILLDVMMPPGKALAPGDSALGLRTGVLLARQIADISSNTPVVILTNSNNPDVLEELKNMDNVKLILQKDSCTPLQLIRELEELLEE